METQAKSLMAMLERERARQQHQEVDSGRLEAWDAASVRAQRTLRSLGLERRVLSGLKRVAP